MTSVAVLGCGPAGLLAAHAARLAGNSPVIFSRKVKSKLGGAQYMHIPIPELCDKKPDTVIRYEVRGDAVGYQRKVYGREEDVPFVSFSNVYHGMREPAWNLRRVYNRLWATWEATIVETDIDPGFMRNRMDKYDVVLSTVPLMSICSHRGPERFHSFKMQQVLIAPLMLETLVGDTIVYDGDPRTSWYRMSLLFGEAMTEWSNGSAVPPLDKIIKVSKPISSDCTCWPEVLKLGRYGRWEKAELSHHAYERTMEKLHAL